MPRQQDFNAGWRAGEWIAVVTAVTPPNEDGIVTVDFVVHVGAEQRYRFTIIGDNKDTILNDAKQRMQELKNREDQLDQIEVGDRVKLDP